MTVQSTQSSTRLPRPEFWAGQRVLITGHTGFKGAWLSCLLSGWGAEVHGLALAPRPGSIFERGKLTEVCASSHLVDITDFERLSTEVARIAPTIVFHLAAQALVLAASDDPRGTFATNVMGSVNLLEAIRALGSPPRAIVIVTSDKCYAPIIQPRAYTEADSLGGKEPYAASKAATEHVCSAYVGARLLRSPLASVRAGNVIGGGDVAPHRLIPDCIRAFSSGALPVIRNPEHVRPWQHVLEPLSGYLISAESLCDGSLKSGEAFNFGPRPGCVRSVDQVVKVAHELWNRSAQSAPSEPPQAPLSANGSKGIETSYLEISSEKAHAVLHWAPRLVVEEALEMTIDWYSADWRALTSKSSEATTAERLRKITQTQISRYFRPC